MYLPSSTPDPTPPETTLSAKGTTGRILVICGVWLPHHSVTRNFNAYVGALSEEFEVLPSFLQSCVHQCLPRH